MAFMDDRNDISWKILKVAPASLRASVGDRNDSDILICRSRSKPTIVAVQDGIPIDSFLKSLLTVAILFLSLHGRKSTTSKKISQCDLSNTFFWMRS